MSDIEDQTAPADPDAPDPTVAEAAPEAPATAPEAADPAERARLLRLVEAVLFAAVEPLDEATVASHLPDGTDAAGVIAELSAHYAARGINLVRIAGRWQFRTAPDLADALRIEREAPRKLSRAAMETLAIVAYHQPVTRADIEEIRGVVVSRGTLDQLLEIGWVKPGRRRDAPGRPVTWLTTDAFLSHFGLDTLKDLPGVKELREAGLLDTRPAISVYGERASDPDALPEPPAGPEEEPAEPLEAGEDGRAA
ncbi:MAG: SMC-Scp complex subunit ScpB [Alphaproteobacteria bacterium]